MVYGKAVLVYLLAAPRRSDFEVGNIIFG